MFTASFYFLGVATSIFAVLFFLATGKRAEKSVDVDLDALHAASICLSTGRRVTLGDLSSSMFKNLPWEEKARLSDWKSLRMQWYKGCERKASLKRKAMYSWARTMALCAVLCLIGVLLEAEFDQPITLQNILAGFRRPSPPASSVETSYRQSAHNGFAPVANRSSRQ
jgi:hypothetical protein